MNIAVLDGYTLNPGDLKWDALAAQGQVKIYDRSTDLEILDRVFAATAVLTNKARISRDCIQNSPDLKYIGVLATGFNVVDLEACRERGVSVTNIPLYGTASVAQLTFSLLLELVNGVGIHSASVLKGEWAKSLDFSYQLTPQIELDGLTLGVIGFGRIGQAVAKLGEAFGMNVIIHSRSHANDKKNVSLEDLFKSSDVVSLHCPLTPQTERIVNEDTIQLMKRSAFLINTSRGGLVDENALAKALQEGKIAGAGLDVLTQEPPTLPNPLLQTPNTIVTPHIAWSTRSARARLLATAVENLRCFKEGHPINVVS